MTLLHTKQLDLATTCTKEEAIARLLGIIRDPVMNVKLYGSQDARVTPPLLIEEELQSFKESADNLLMMTSHMGGSKLTLAVLDTAVRQWDARIAQARYFRFALDDELAKGEASAIDWSHDAASGELIIGLSSLNRWAAERFGLDLSSLNPPVQIGPVSSSAAREELGETGTETLYTTLAFAVEAFAALAHEVNGWVEAGILSSIHSKKYAHNDGLPNVSAIAQRVADVAEAANGGKPRYRMGYSNVRKLITVALETVRDAFPGKKGAKK